MSRLRETDWGATPLGSPSAWPPELSHAIRTVLPSRQPNLIWWGADLVQLYNDAFAELIGDKHPQGLAAPAVTCWAEAWADLGPTAAAVMAGDGPVHSDQQFLFLNRHGYLEETYWTLSYSPIRGPGETVLGVLVQADDCTAQTIGPRRLQTVHSLATLPMSEMSTPQDACAAAVSVMANNRMALPFTAMYLSNSAGDLTLAASSGLRPGSRPFPLTVPSGNGSALAAVASDGRQRELDGLVALAEPGDLEPSPLGGSVPDAAVAIALTTPGQAEPLGVLVLGINPYRQLDAEYQTFFDLVSRQLSTLVSDVQAQAGWRQRAADLADLDAAKTMFFQNVSHEFRTPLTLILASLEELVDAGTPADEVAAASTAARQLDRLVDALLTFAEAESGDVHLNPSTVDVRALTADICAMFRSAIESRGIKLRVDLPDPCTTFIDADSWVRIVSNLLSNALKYTTAGSVDVALRSDEQHVTLTVRDTGMGISEHLRGSVFERFQRGSATASQVPGAGIGLALVQDLAVAQGGEVLLDSTEGVGSTFTVTLPRTAGPPVPSDGPASEPLRHAGVLAEVESTEPSPDAVPDSVGGMAELAPGAPPTPHVMVVEDHDDMRDYLTRLLAGDGLQVTAVATAEEALQKLETGALPDLYVSDVMLPGMDGLGLVRRLRTSARTARTPVILLTARAGAAAAAEGLEAGADDYIIKPFQKRDLLARVRVNLELSALREDALRAAELEARTLHDAVASNRRIGAAVGFVMREFRVDDAQAFRILRRISNQTNRRLAEVAEHIVSSRSLSGVSRRERRTDSKDTA